MNRIDDWIDAHGWIIPLVLAAAVAVLFGGTLHFDFVYDDHWFILQNQSLSSIFPIARFFTDPLTSALPASGIPLDVYRPLSTLSFAITKALAGFSPPWFRVVNIFLHAMNGMLLWRLLRKSATASAALMAALLFLVHPLQVESVVWISQRSILLCAFGALAALVCWEKAAEDARWSAAAAFFYAFALFSKETAIGLPLLMALRVEDSDDARLKSLPVFVVMGAAYVIGRTQVLGHLGQGAPLGVSAADGVRALAHYGRLILWPTGLNVSYRWPLSLPGSSPDFWIGAAMLMSMLGGIVSLWNPRRRLALGLAAFLVFWAPHSGVLPLVTFAADRFMYMPLIGIAYIFCSFIVERPRLRPFAAAFLIMWGAASVIRTADWRDDLSLWGASLRVDSKNPFALATYAAALQNRGRSAEAEETYKLALQNGPTVRLAHMVLLTLRDLAEKRGDTAAEVHWREKLSTIPK